MIYSEEPCGVAAGWLFASWAFMPNGSMLLFHVFTFFPCSFVGRDALMSLTISCPLLWSLWRLCWFRICGPSACSTPEQKPPPHRRRFLRGCDGRPVPVRVQWKGDVDQTNEDCMFLFQMYWVLNALPLQWTCHNSCVFRRCFLFGENGAKSWLKPILYCNIVGEDNNCYYNNCHYYRGQRWSNYNMDAKWQYGNKNTFVRFCKYLYTYIYITARERRPPAKDPPNSQAYLQTYIQAYIQNKAEAILTSIYIKQNRHIPTKTKQTHYNNAPPKQHPKKQNSKKNILPYIIVSIV